MTQRREIKQRSPAVWAKVREAYLAGEPAASVARRFDVGVGNLRYRANAEGWTRKAALSSEQQAEDAETMRLKGEVVPLESTTTAERASSEARKDTLIQAMSPREQMAYALKRAARSLAAGRASEAEGLIRAVRALGEITGTTPPRLEDLEADPTEDLEGIIRSRGVSRLAGRSQPLLARTRSATGLRNLLLPSARPLWPPTRWWCQRGPPVGRGAQARPASSVGRRRPRRGSARAQRSRDEGHGLATGDGFASTTGWQPEGLCGRGDVERERPSSWV